MTEILQWVKTHDADCKQIAKFAATFFDTYLKLHGQSTFVRELLERVADFEEALVGPKVSKYIQELGLKEAENEFDYTVR